MTNFHPHPLSSEAEEGGDKHSDVGVSR
jgi:hypothetical protein